MSWLELKEPPVVVATATIVAMWAIREILPNLTTPFGEEYTNYADRVGRWF